MRRADQTRLEEVERMRQADQSELEEVRKLRQADQTRLEEVERMRRADANVVVELKKLMSPHGMKFSLGHIFVRINCAIKNFYTFKGSVIFSINLL